MNVGTCEIERLKASWEIFYGESCHLKPLVNTLQREASSGHDSGCYVLASGSFFLGRLLLTASGIASSAAEDAASSTSPSSSV